MLDTLALPLGTLQETIDVRSWRDPSLYVPLAVNCCVNPLAMDALGGFIASDLSTAAVTVKVALAEIVLFGYCALIVAEPMPIVAASPLLPAAFDTDAIVADTELQVTELVRSFVVASVKMPVAVNC
jgi:hypothetical protein